MKRIASLFIITSILFLQFTGCKKDHGDPPALPPAATMKIDFVNFISDTKSDVPDSQMKGEQITNWKFAAGTTLIWRTLVNTTLAIPVEAFRLAQGRSPEYTGDNTWEWKYSASITVDQATATYNARLTGQIRSNDVLWKMNISKDGTGAFSEFVWFEGTSTFDGNSGSWTLNESSQSQVPVLKIDWTKSGDAISKIKYTYIKTGSPLNNSYIDYGLTTNALNAYFNIHFFNTTYQTIYDVKIEWSTTEGNGRVQCINHFGDYEWYSWDGNHINI